MSIYYNCYAPELFKDAVVPDVITLAYYTRYVDGAVTATTFVQSATSGKCAYRKMPTVCANNLNKHETSYPADPVKLFACAPDSDNYIFVTAQGRATWRMPSKPFVSKLLADHASQLAVVALGANDSYYVRSTSDSAAWNVDSTALDVIFNGHALRLVAFHPTNHDSYVCVKKDNSSFFHSNIPAKMLEHLKSNDLSQLAHVALGHDSTYVLQYRPSVRTSKPGANRVVQPGLLFQAYEADFLNSLPSASLVSVAYLSSQHSDGNHVQISAVLKDKTAKHHNAPAGITGFCDRLHASDGDDVHTVSCMSIGNGGACFAESRTKLFRGASIPQRCRDWLDGKTDVVFVTLGFGGSWAAQTKQGVGSSWGLSPTAYDCFRQQACRLLALHPDIPGAFVAVMKDTYQHQGVAETVVNKLVRVHPAHVRSLQLGSHGTVVIHATPPQVVTVATQTESGSPAKSQFTAPAKPQSTTPAKPQPATPAKAQPLELKATSPTQASSTCGSPLRGAAAERRENGCYHVVKAVPQRTHEGQPQHLIPGTVHESGKDTWVDNGKLTFQVEFVSDTRISPVSGKRQYLVKWVGFGLDSNTWEPLADDHVCVVRFRRNAGQWSCASCQTRYQLTHSTCTKCGSSDAVEWSVLLADRGGKSVGLTNQTTLALEDALLAGVSSIRHVLRNPPNGDAIEYVFDLRNMTQKNTKTGNVMRIVRSPTSADLPPAGSVTAVLDQAACRSGVQHYLCAVKSARDGSLCRRWATSAPPSAVDQFRARATWYCGACGEKNQGLEAACACCGLRAHAAWHEYVACVGGCTHLWHAYSVVERALLEAAFASGSQDRASLQLPSLFFDDRCDEASWSQPAHVVSFPAMCRVAPADALPNQVGKAGRFVRRGNTQLTAVERRTVWRALSRAYVALPSEDKNADRRCEALTIAVSLAFFSEATTLQLPNDVPLSEAAATAASMANASPRVRARALAAVAMVLYNERPCNGPDLVVAINGSAVNAKTAASMSTAMASDATGFQFAALATDDKAEKTRLYAASFTHGTGNAAHVTRQLEFFDESDATQARAVASRLLVEDLVDNAPVDGACVYRTADGLLRAFTGNLPNLSRKALISAVCELRGSRDVAPKLGFDACAGVPRKYSRAALEDLANTFGNKALSDRIYLVKGQDNNRKAWYYVLVLGPLARFLQCINDDVIHLEEHGKILHSAYGEEPPVSITDRVESNWEIKGNSDEHLTRDWQHLAGFLRDAALMTPEHALHELSKCDCSTLEVPGLRTPTSGDIKAIMEACRAKAAQTRIEGWSEDLELHESFKMVIVMYTLQTPYPVFQLLNAPFYTSWPTSATFKHHRPLLRLLLTALLALPGAMKFTGTVYRGLDVRGRPQLERLASNPSEYFAAGARLAFGGPTSATTSEAAAQRFAHGLLFELRGVTGFKIAALSVFPNEREVFLTPPTTIVVKEWRREANGVRVIADYAASQSVSYGV